ncbi:MAG: leucine-rich repeat domain-containing protein [Lachnospiraceae bacterium]|nr:leucine-rich repeat domain-containing protein [Lachnospiraceae bacterium]
MKKGTKIGWALVALSVIISAVVIIAGSSNADQQVGDFILSDDGTVAIQYTGAGGSVSIPDGVVTLSDGLFMNNTTITNISMPDTVTSLGSNFCSGCSQLQSISLSSNIATIPANAFRECSGLLSISLPSVASIGDYAFYGCASLSSITIPASCTSIADTAFGGCDNLSEISVSSGNSNYSSSDGCLYNAAKSRLIYVPGGKSSVSIADTCSTIGSGAFRDVLYVSSLTLPDSVETIEADAFSGSSISTITIPATTTSIGSQSNWTPSTIYGYADSAAETYAKNNSIPFVVIGNPEPSPTPTPDPGTGGGGTGGGGTSSGGTVNPDGSVTNADGTTTLADGTVIETATGRVLRAGTGSTGSSHTKDATPGTADGINPVYFLCLAIFLGGVGVIVYTKIRKVNYLKKKK